MTSSKKRLHQSPGGGGREPYLPDFLIENDLDYTRPYPCGVCKKSFTSRHSLATHSHRKANTR